MVGAARPVGGASSLQHDAVLAAVASTAEHLLLAADWREAADEVLSPPGDRGRRVPGLRDREPDRRRRTARGDDATRVVRTGVSSQFGNPVLEAVPWWVRSVGRGPCPRRAGLRLGRRHARGRTHGDRGAGYRLHRRAPRTVGDEWWGAIGFDDCERERRWASEPRRPAARGDRREAAVARHRVEHERREAEHRRCRWSSTSLLSRTPTSSRPTRCAWSS